ncbi:2,3-dimethylmalate dehydratase large subunit [Sporotomaculum syntrophicum]|uniref:2,3-dimethylmalate dehydratase large subunit n=1 Tax=Sporotomaculum syntrophicum TaxID=182264 RepID=A0A9D2WQR9_9FIRM|nr:aconitate hydratase [Sporotomaculum syntrophicum]KAF1085719.1 2,3-dimethylmalate dehydratase large subunit [Sporotomaculum syntrophicum]
MGQNMTRKIIAAHLAEGEMIPGQEIALKIDQTLTQDATGTMAYLEFEAIGIPAVRTELSVSYVDHNTLQVSYENADDHRFLQSAAAKFGVKFSRMGNGICHQVHLERFGVPGKTLLGSDSHTPTSGGLGMLAIGAGGLDVATAMAGYPFYVSMPQVVNIHLYGKPAPWVTAKDIILEVLRLLTVKGGVGKVMEYTGEGVSYLSVPDRATITNMGAELGATSSIFPSDEVTARFLAAQERAGDFVALGPDPDAEYDEVLEINLSELEPLIALPHMPDNVVKIADVAGRKVDQVFIGSCTNSSYTDLMRVAAILKGKTVHPGVSLVIAPGSRQVLVSLAANGALTDLVAAGARMLECACGPCVGVGQSPCSAGVSLRTCNRNFEGRSGTVDAKIYLVSCEAAAAAALTGVITDPRDLGEPIKVEMPEKFPVDDRMIIVPPANREDVSIVRGPNIQPLPVASSLPGEIKGEVLLKVGDNITTDHIMPAGANIMALRSNIPAISMHAFERVDATFAERALAAGGGIIVGGLNYGQGSSREHAALAPLYLGIKTVLVKSFARIHMQNLVNFGLLPLTFVNDEDYDTIDPGDVLLLEDVRQGLVTNTLTVRNLTRDKAYPVKHSLSERQIEIMLAGGLLKYVKEQV